jgi:glycosyltransferase involved in cell wall biosynthesis
MIVPAEICSEQDLDEDERQKYHLEALEQIRMQADLGRLRAEMSELKAELSWINAKTRELEAAPWIFRIRNTQGLTGWRLRSAEFSNTISRLLWHTGKRNFAEGVYASNDSLETYAGQSPHDTFRLREKRLTDFVKNRSINLNNRDRILVDITCTLSTPQVSGIQRVCWEFCNAGLDNVIVPVFIHESNIFSFDIDRSLSVPVELRSGEKFLWLDSSWDYRHEVAKLMRNIEDLGGSNIFLLYDLIPALQPHLTVPHVSLRFEEWLKSCVLYANEVICISETVARDFISYSSQYCHRVKRVGWCHLGSDLPVPFGVSVSKEVRQFVERNKNIFLSVGTIEPRKGYITAIDAFNQLWQQQYDAAYVIVGRYGWSADSVRMRLKNCAETGRLLLWLESASDGDLNFLYENARALIYPTISEGFGLPIVEAALKGLPVIASDIPICREVGGDGATYFELCNSVALASCISNALNEQRKRPNIMALSWKESTHNAIQMIRNDRYQFIIDESINFSERQM